jgi:hypothetical protein
MHSIERTYREKTMDSRSGGTGGLSAGVRRDGDLGRVVEVSGRVSDGEGAVNGQIRSWSA